MPTAAGTILWQPQVMTAEAHLAGLLDVRGGQKASAGGTYDDLFGRDSLRMAKVLALYHPDAAIEVLCALAQYQGVTTDAATNQFPDAIPHQVHRTIVNGVAIPDELEKEVAYWADKWGVESTLTGSAAGAGRSTTTLTPSASSSSCWP